jgi:hypothetical protein
VRNVKQRQSRERKREKKYRNKINVRERERNKKERRMDGRKGRKINDCPCCAAPSCVAVDISGCFTRACRILWPLLTSASIIHYVLVAET